MVQRLIPLNAKDKELIEGHSGKWICEIADLQGHRKAEAERVKATLSRQVDRARLAYAKLPIEVPRQCIFVGTTNGKQYLVDQTGNRRFWPIRIDHVDIKALGTNRNQLWAEASVREAKGESIRLAAKHWPAAIQEQNKRAVDNPFLDALAAGIQGRDGVLFMNDAYEFLGIQPKQRFQSDAERIGQAWRCWASPMRSAAATGVSLSAPGCAGRDRFHFMVGVDHGQRYLKHVGVAAADAEGEGAPF